MKNKLIIKILKRYACLSVILLAISLAGCKKEITPALPGDVSGMGLNFYPASDVIAAYANLRQLTAIYVDQYNITLPGSLNSAIPAFYYSGNGTAEEYPGLYNVFSYVRYNAGSHRLMFTDTTNTVVVDTTLDFPAKTFHSIYFADAPVAANARAAYKMIAVEEKREPVPAGKIGVRFVHLSADAGDLTVTQQKPGGTIVQLLPKAIGFLEATPYQYLDDSQAISGLLRFALTNASNGASALTGVQFYPGHSYVIVISGFLNDQQRQIPAGKNPDGSRQYTSITIQKNLRATVRRSY
jgi:hypothetical protein